MLNIAYIFPGQGAQYVGMGEDFYYHYPQAKEAFERANDVLNFQLSELIFKGPVEKLTQTCNSQVAIFTASYAFLQALEAEYPDITQSFTAGLSLGEYTALVAAGALEFEEALRLVKARGKYMDEASRGNPGGMVSLIGVTLDVAKEISQKTKVEIANLNCPGQIVISGTISALEQAKELAKASGARKIIPLKVSGAFHSSLMIKASQRLAEKLEKVEIRPPKVPVVSNVTARKEMIPAEIKDNLARQVTSTTLWDESVRYISSSGVKNFIEIGPGKVLRGLLRKIDQRLLVTNIETVEDLKKLKEEFKQ